MIEVKNLNKKYGKKQVLKDINFTAKKGEITCLIGVNGAGKTTILNAIMRLIPYKKGEVLINGKKLASEPFFNTITYVPDRTIMLQQQTIRQAMDFMADYYPIWNEEKAQDLLTFFRLDEKDKIRTLSKGNMAKLNLLLGLALDTEFILMDEPFSGIDVFTREKIAEVFTSKLVDDKGVILTTHEINEIEYVVDKVVLLHEGTIVKEFYPEEHRATHGQSIIDVMREVYVQ